ncbi:MAG: hypothetical protein AAB154_08425 [Candidatus Binatota bacterium]
MINPKFASLLLSVFLAGISGCASYSVKLIHPQSGATARCGAEGVGIMAGGAGSFVEECLKKYESQGYLSVEELTPEQRADLERRGLLPKPEPPTFRMGY